MKTVEVEIKYYEPRDDEGLINLCKTNLFQTQTITSEMLIEGAILRYGWCKIILVF